VIILKKDELVNVLKLSRIMTAAKQMTVPPTAVSAVTDRPIRVLIIDDSISAREIEKTILESHGYRVMLAADGIEGFEKLAADQYDLIVSDIDMPRMDGFVFTHQAKNDDRYADIPISLVTARDTEADRRRGIQVGAEAYIVKGDFDQNNLLETIRTLVG
jgi:two-component system chemotaxis sensor kinase CheA